MPWVCWQVQVAAPMSVLLIVIYIVGVIAPQIEADQILVPAMTRITSIKE